MSLDFVALRELSLLSALDVHFATAMARLAGEADARVVLAAALVSQKVQAGHVCLDLPALCRDETVVETAQGPRAIAWPALDDWLAALRASPLAGDENTATPLFLDREGRLYLRRYYEHERSLAESIRARAERPPAQLDRGALREALDRLFGPEPVAASPGAGARRQLDLFAQPTSSSDPPSRPDQPDRQRLAAQRAAERAFCVISGGPGTGKTSTVVKILALLVEQALARETALPRMLLLAPTGKAAARLSEAIKRAKSKLPTAPAVRAAVPEEASTIHRALGALGGHAQRFRHHRDAPLAADVIVVDEASMVDLALMARLFEAVPADARVLLLGDKDQLASVEAGAVLGDICGVARAGLTGARDGGLAASIALLTRSYRYAEDSGIRKLAEAINQAQPERALDILRDPGLPDVTLVEPAQHGLAELWSAAVTGFTPLFHAEGAEAKLRALERFAVLCAHRRGPFGQLAINARIEVALRNAGMIPPTGSERYAGRPVMVTQNDYQARLFNGEVGVLSRDAAQRDRMLAHFLSADGQLREIAAARLPPHESAYALSVHKSQGSEFDEVAVVLPGEPSPVLSRELLYTAVTRARRKLVIHASAEIVALAVERTVLRASGLRDALWGVTA